MERAASTSEQETKEGFDPDSFRMSLGDHLEELRWRLILGIGGFVVVAAVCLVFGEHMLTLLCEPLTHALRKYNLTPQVYMTNITDAFVVYMQVSLIWAAAIAGPWMLYQLWQFVRSGLYPKERHYVTKYMPFSIGLLITGMLFLYFVVLPITLNFLLHFSIGIKLPEPPSRSVPASPMGMVERVQPLIIPSIPGNPEKPVENQLWVDTEQHRIKFFFGGEVRIVAFGAQNLVSPMITLPNYISLVMQLMLMFGLTFQLPLVVMAVAKMGLVDVATLRKWRRGVYFGISILCGVVVPDVVTGMIAMMIPLIILYEIGIILAARSISKAAAEEASVEEESK